MILQVYDSMAHCLSTPGADSGSNNGADNMNNTVSPTLPVTADKQLNPSLDSFSEGWKQPLNSTADQLFLFFFRNQCLEEELRQQTEPTSQCDAPTVIW